ncbi:MAG: hypothetical protein HY903_03380 [Deltaproteobacteria bacterium]|nr:hypothetical protein [Deltaproteobacteria bacterium]
MRIVMVLGASLCPVVLHAAEAAPAPERPAAAEDPSASSSAAAASPETDAALLREIQAATAPPVGAAVLPDLSATPPPPLTTVPARPASGIGPSSTYNPAMSANGLFQGALTSNRRPSDGGLQTALAIQELELQLLTHIDPYFAANLILSLPEGEGIGAEEAYVTPSAQPFGLQARIGKLKLPFGRENALHTHALPFVDKSLVGAAVFGAEGLAEIGVELSWLLPLPWYAVLYGAVVNGDNPVELAAAEQYAMASFAALKHVFDLSDDATLEAGASFAGGKNANAEWAQVGGGHLVFKWRPARQAAEREAIVMVEALYATRPNDARVLGLYGRDQSIGGAYAYAQWRLAPRWYTAARYDYLGYPSAARGITRRASAILVFAPSEFSALRLEVRDTLPPFHAEPIYEGLLQLNFTLGAHPAHTY